MIGRLVIGSVTTSESLLLYVLDFLIRSDPYGKVDEEFLVTRWSTPNIISRSIEAKEQGFAELDVGRVITYLNWHRKVEWVGNPAYELVMLLGLVGRSRMGVAVDVERA